MAMPYFCLQKSYFLFLSLLRTSLKCSPAVTASKGCFLSQDFETAQDHCDGWVSHPEKWITCWWFLFFSNFFSGQSTPFRHTSSRCPKLFEDSYWTQDFALNHQIRVSLSWTGTAYVTPVVNHLLSTTQLIHLDWMLLLLGLYWLC